MCELLYRASFGLLDSRRFLEKKHMPPPLSIPQCGFGSMNTHFRTDKLRGERKMYFAYNFLLAANFKKPITTEYRNRLLYCFITCIFDLKPFMLLVLRLKERAGCFEPYL